MLDNTSQSLWPDLDPPAPTRKKGRGGAAARPPEPRPSKARGDGGDVIERAPAMFCPIGGLTPWLRDYPTGKALCGRCERRDTEGCALAGRQVAPDASPDCHTPGLTGLIKVVGRS